MSKTLDELLALNYHDFRTPWLARAASIQIPNNLNLGSLSCVTRLITATIFKTLFEFLIHPQPFVDGVTQFLHSHVKMKFSAQVICKTFTKLRPEKRGVEL